MAKCICIHNASHHRISGCVYCVCKYDGIPILKSDNLVATQPFPSKPANNDELIQYTADQLDIPYRVSKAGREYCVYYLGSGKGLIELIIMSNLAPVRVSRVDNNTPWYVTWTTPTTTHKETIAKFTDLLLLIQLLQEGVNAKTLRKAATHK